MWEEVESLGQLEGSLFTKAKVIGIHRLHLLDFGLP